MFIPFIKICDRFYKSHIFRRQIHQSFFFLIWGMRGTTMEIRAEKIAKKFNFPVLYLGVKKVKRGYYEMRVKVLTETPNALAEGEITQLYVNELEKDLREQPFNWLWSHKRWKHKKPA